MAYNTTLPKARPSYRKKHHLQNMFASYLGKLATDDEKWINWNDVTNSCLKSMYDSILWNFWKAQ